MKFLALLNLLYRLFFGAFTHPLNVAPRVYGCTPDAPDARDHIYSGFFNRKKPQPARASVRALMPPVYDQETLGACTGNGLAAFMVFLHMKLFSDGTPLSRLYIYWCERFIEGTVNEDSGAMIRDGIKAIAKHGVCDERFCPYVIADFKNKPSEAAYLDAIPRTISVYQRILTLADMKQCLVDGYPFVFGFQVFESFESDTVAQTGTVPMPTSVDRNLGGHCVLAVGYDDATQRFECRNSWGDGWGDGGYFTLPYAYMTNAKLVSDIWTIRK